MMPNDLEKNTDFIAGNDSMLAQAESHISSAVENLTLAIEAARHVQHDRQSDALVAIRKDLESKAELLRSMRKLKY